jgi:hypothetical protein
LHVVGLIDLPDMLDDLAVVFVGAVGEVQSEHVNASLGQLQQFVKGVAGWAYCGDDLSIEICNVVHILTVSAYFNFNDISEQIVTPSGDKIPGFLKFFLLLRAGAE